VDENFHPGDYGGDRKSTFKDFELPLVNAEITNFVRQCPSAHLHDVTAHLASVFGRPIENWTTSRLLTKLGWSWKIPICFQLRKYTTTNLERYLHYTTAIAKLDPTKLRFLDEAHFVSKELSNHKVLSLVNHCAYVKQSTLNQKNGTFSRCLLIIVTGTLTIITSLVGPPLVCTYTEETNSAASFLDFILLCCLNGNLKQGDFLIMDNAPIHNNSYVDVLKMLLEFFGVMLVFLPAYSPELNPCELVFSVIKNHIRNYWDGIAYIFHEILIGLQTITPEKNAKFL
jgi:transposase